MRKNEKDTPEKEIHCTNPWVPQHERVKFRVRGEVRRCEGTIAHHSSQQLLVTYTNSRESNALRTFYVMVAQRERRKLEWYVGEGERFEGTKGECRRVYVLWRSIERQNPFRFLFCFIFLSYAYAYILPRLRKICTHWQPWVVKIRTLVVSSPRRMGHPQLVDVGFLLHRQEFLRVCCKTIMEIGWK